MDDGVTVPMEIQPFLTYGRGSKHERPERRIESTAHRAVANGLFVVVRSVTAEAHRKQRPHAQIAHFDLSTACRAPYVVNLQCSSADASCFVQATGQLGTHLLRTKRSGAC